MIWCMHPPVRPIGVALAWCAALLCCTSDPPNDGGPAAPGLVEPTALPSSTPYVLVLGTAQDGGLPHLGCDAQACMDARRDPAKRRFVTSLLLCDPRDGRRYLFDCTPDLKEQMEVARGHPASRHIEEPRPPLFEALFLTHAHMGHYGGLLQLGREAFAVKELPTFVTPRFAEFLRDNGPWKLMVDERRLTLQELDPAVAVALAPDLAVRCFRVPHRDEFSDTVGFVIDGPHRDLLYLPDIDKWEAFDGWTAPDGNDGGGGDGGNIENNGGIHHIEEALAAVDIALIDGCFFADGEIAGRSMKAIPHPFIVESIARFAKLPLATREKIFFTHLNHTNAAADPGGEAARAVIAAGMHVLDEGRVFGL